MDWVSRALRHTLWLAMTGLLLSAAAQAGDVQLSLTVAHVSESAAGVEETPVAKRAHAILGKQLRYSSLKVLSSGQHTLQTNQMWEHGLPNNTTLRARASDVSEGGVFLSVDWPGSAQGDFRVQRGKPLVIGGPNYQDGKLVLILQLDY
ncbi:MAG: hypothetical protein HKP27_13420 [Myxococcales bacterium]|nr:hypothetical protein [Myxococcales bacterium]